MKKTFEEGMRIALTDYDTGQIKDFRIVSRDGEHAMLKDSKGKAFYAKIRKVKAPEGECLDVRGFNALFSHDLHLNLYSEATTDYRGRPSKQAFLNKEQVIAALKSTNNLHEAASVFGISATTLAQFMRTHDLKSPRKRIGHREPTFSDDDVVKVQKALLENISISATAQVFHCHPRTLSAFIKKHGIIVPQGSKHKAKQNETNTD